MSEFAQFTIIAVIAQLVVFLLTASAAYWKGYAMGRYKSVDDEDQKWYEDEIKWLRRGIAILYRDRREVESLGDK